MSIDSINSSITCSESCPNQDSVAASSQQSSSIAYCWNEAQGYLTSYFNAPLTTSVLDAAQLEEIDFSKGDFIDDRSWQLIHTTDGTEGFVRLQYIPSSDAADQYSELFELSCGEASAGSIERVLEYLEEGNDPELNKCRFVIHERTPSSCLYEVWIHEIPQEDSSSLSTHELNWQNYHLLCKVVQQDQHIVVISYATCNMEEPLTTKWVPVFNKFGITEL